MRFKIPEQHFVIFKSSLGSQVKVLRGDGAPKMTAGSGGWSVISRPRRTSLTQWTGRDPYRMDIPILFDGFRNDKSVESGIARLNSMSIGHDYDPPPTLIIEGGVPIKGATWVIDSIDWGDNVYWESSNGHYFRTRQDAVVHLLQYQAESRLNITMPKTLPGQYIVTRDGMTLKEAVKAYYGNTKKYKAVLSTNKGNDANHVRDPNNLRKGLTLTMP
jgi:hypothetical protein